MPPPNSVQDSVTASLLEQLRPLQPTLENLVPISDLLADLNTLAALVSDPILLPLIKGTPASLVEEVTTILTGKKPDGSGADATMADFGGVLVQLNILQAQVGPWLSTNVALLPSDKDQIIALVTGAITKTRQLLNLRPDVEAVMSDLSAMQQLQGGPADATAFHDFHVLKMAFKSVWMHAFSDDLKNAAGELYEQANQIYKSNNVLMPDPGAIEDIGQLNDFIDSLSGVTGIVADTSGGVSSGTQTTANSANAALITPPPAVVADNFPDASKVWALLSDDQRASVISWAEDFAAAGSGTTTVTASTISFMQYVSQVVAGILAAPSGTGGRLAQLINDITKAQQEPYAFDVFAPNSYNFGLIITYRQIWQPGTYQAGDLVSTIPLAPGETRKYSSKRTVKESVSRRTAQRSNEARSQQSTEDSRAENDIMQRSSSATNFKIATSGSFNIGIGSIDASSEFGGNTSSESTQSKKDFHEATLKAAEEYRLERSLEVSTNTSTETEETFSGEISNPNNEITVTYLFYELQRRYRIREYLYRVQPVIMIAQEVPAPEQINESWLLQYQWIIARVLLDDSLRPALQYLSSGYAGDELALATVQTQWKTQAALVKQLEATVQSEMLQRDQMRETLIETQQQEDSIPEMPGVLNVFTLGVDPSDSLKKTLNAQIKAGQSRLKYADEALADAQEKLRNASNAFQQATRDYSAALQNKYSRQIAIDQLRIHVKQNIFYYMQAIWAHEVPDERFFRLYKQKVLCPQVQQNCAIKVSPGMIGRFTAAGATLPIEIPDTCVPGAGAGGLGGNYVDLVSIADIDNPVGYKGNYLMFPLTTECPITDYMLTDYIDTYLGLKDPDGSGDFDAEDFDNRWQQAKANNDANAEAALRSELLLHIEDMERSTDEIIVPTGQLFIEALPGTHTLLEQFKLDHRMLDVETVRAQNRHAELENLRLAARLAADPPLLQDPDIEKRIVVDKELSAVVDTNP